MIYLEKTDPVLIFFPLVPCDWCRSNVSVPFRFWSPLDVSGSNLATPVEIFWLCNLLKWTIIIQYILHMIPLSNCDMTYPIFLNITLQSKITVLVKGPDSLVVIGFYNVETTIDVNTAQSSVL